MRYAALSLVVVGIAAVGVVLASPGDTLYVQKKRVNIRSGPGTGSSVVMTLNKGHELIEFSRRGSWINVGIARAGGKDGWVHSSLVGATFSGGATTAPEDPRFDAFVRDVEKLNDKTASIVGFRFFPRLENLGDGIVQLTADSRWIAASREDQEKNLNTLFRLWNVREGTGLPIAVYIVDSAGNVVMRKARQ